MHGVREIIQEASILPVEDRTLIIDSLLRTMNQPDNEIDREWVSIAQRRLDDLRSGKVQGIPGEEVFIRVRQRFQR
jgi:putative addiction module component (TIGR02574 family)